MAAAMEEESGLPYVNQCPEYLRKLWADTANYVQRIVVPIERPEPPKKELW